MSTNDLRRYVGTAVSRPRCEWAALGAGRSGSPVEWRKRESGAMWASRDHAIRRTEPASAAPVGVLQRLNDELEQLHQRQLDAADDARIESEIERLERLAATLLQARANIGISRVSNAIDSAVVRAERLLAEKP